MSTARWRGASPATAAAVVALVLAPAVLAGCGAGDPSASAAGADALAVVATPPAMLEVAQRVGGDDVSATGPASAGADAHAVELTGDQVATVVDADVVVHVGGLSPSVDDAVALREGRGEVDAAGVDPRSERDPHVWLDPALVADVAGLVAEELSAADPDGADGYARRAEEYAAELDALDADLAEVLAPCRGAVLVTAHEAFGFLADRYGLEQTGVTGVDPHVEPTPARLRAVADQGRETGVRTVFFDEVTSTGVAQTLADEAGVTTAVLSPLETSVEPDYATAMRANGDALRDGLVCEG